MLLVHLQMVRVKGIKAVLYMSSFGELLKSARCCGESRRDLGMSVGMGADVGEVVAVGRGER